MQNHPEDAKAGVAKLSAAAQKPATEILKIFTSTYLSPREKFEEAQKIHATLPPDVSDLIRDTLTYLSSASCNRFCAPGSVVVRS